MDMGTGKTLTAILEMCRLFWLGRIDGCLIIAPKGVYMNWVERELPKHVSHQFNIRLVHWQAGAGKKHQTGVRHVTESPPPDDSWLDIFVMNTEAVASKKGQRAARNFLNTHTTMMVVDESSTIKNYQAERTKVCIALGKHCKYRRILTGTPTPNSPMDVFSQFQFIDDRILGDCWWSFRSRYAKMKDVEMGPRKFKQIVGFQNMNELRRKVAAHSTRVLAEDCMDLPPKTYLTRDVELTPEQEELYISLRRRGIIELEEVQHTEGSVTATHVLTRMRRMMEVVWGYVTLDDAPEDASRVKYIPSNRMAQLFNWAGEVHGKAIIWCNCVPMLHQIVLRMRKEFGVRAVTSYYGIDTFDNVQEFEHKGNTQLKFMVANPAKGGMGIELLQATQVLYFTNSFNFQDRVQSERRNYRNGQDKHVVYTDLLARGTIDEKIVKALIDKYEMGLKITGENWKEWLEC